MPPGFPQCTRKPRLVFVAGSPPPPLLRYRRRPARRAWRSRVVANPGCRYGHNSLRPCNTGSDLFAAGPGLGRWYHPDSWAHSCCCDLFAWPLFHA